MNKLSEQFLNAMADEIIEKCQSHNTNSFSMELIAGNTKLCGTGYNLNLGNIESAKKSLIKSAEKLVTKSPDVEVVGRTIEVGQYEIITKFLCNYIKKEESVVNMEKKFVVEDMFADLMSAVNERGLDRINVLTKTWKEDTLMSHGGASGLTVEQLSGAYEAYCKEAYSYQIWVKPTLTMFEDDHIALLVNCKYVEKEEKKPVFNMNDFVAPKPRTLKQDLGMLCSSAYTTPGIKYVSIQLENDAANSGNYDVKDYAKAKDMLKDILADYSDCTYIKGKVYPDFCYAQLSGTKNIINKEESVIMNKTQLRSLLAKTYGVKLEPAEFKAMSVADLTARVEAEKVIAAQKANDAVFTSVEPVVEKEVAPVLMGQEVAVNVTPKVPAIINKDDFGSLLSNMLSNVAVNTSKALNNMQTEVKMHTTTESDRVIADLTAKLNSMDATIQALMNKVSATPTSTGQPLGNNAPIVDNRQQVANNTKRYNEYAAGLKPTHYITNARTGKQEAVFGKCSVCGCDIKSAKVIAFCDLNFGLGHHTCYVHQAQVAKTIDKKNVQQPPVTQNKTSEYVTHTCMYCSKPVTFASQAVLDKRMAQAKALGLAPIGHVECLKKAKEELLANMATGFEPQDYDLEYTPTDAELNAVMGCAEVGATVADEISIGSSNESVRGIIDNGGRIDHKLVWFQPAVKPEGSNDSDDQSDF